MVCNIAVSTAAPTVSPEVRQLWNSCRNNGGSIDGSCLDDSGIEEERAGGGPGPTGGGPEKEDRGRIRANDVYPEYWRSIH